MITARLITVTAATNTKGYDGTLSAAAIPTITSGTLASGDTASFTESYVSANVGTGKTLVPAGLVLDGNAGNNYTVTFVNDTTGVITARLITVTVTASNKIYDGTTAATVQSTLTGVVGGDVVTLAGGSATFADRNVGVGKLVTLSGYSLAGAHAGNYFLFNTTATASATITPKPLSITADNKTKVYGAANPDFTASYVGLVNSDTSADITGLTLTSAATAASPVGGYTIVAAGATASNYTIIMNNGTLTVTTKSTAVVLSVSPGTVQYSDLVTLSAAVSPTFIAGSQLTGSVTFVIAGEPAILPVTIDASGNASVTVALAGQVTPVGAGALAKIVTATFASTNANYAGSAASDSVSEVREGARIDYTGDGLKLTASATTSTAPVNFAAVVREDADGNLGTKLDTTMVKFSAYKYSDTAMTGPPVVCTTPALTVTTAGVATGSCPMTLGVDNYTVKMELLGNGYYVAPQETVAVTVAVPGTGFTTGGGWVNEPTLQTRSNFGFTVKYLKNGNIQGNSLYIYRKTLAANQVVNPAGGFLPAGEYNWIIKSNAMTQLTQSCTTTLPIICKATFTGKATISAVNRATGLVYGLGGNMQFQVDVTDNGEPGSSSSTTPDTYAIKVYDSSGTYYQLGSTTSQLALNGGNIQVRP